MHFTYEAVSKASDLQQGDLLERTPALNAAIAEYHPYYSSVERYTHFLVLTQSCDLVRRDGKPCSCPYISVAAVRPLQVVLDRDFESYKQNPILRHANAISDKNRGRIENHLITLINNNSKEYFYLHEEPSVGLYSSCAVLRLSIALKSSEHYETCSQAKLITLTDEFRAKLGWLIGNLYARIGTEDWGADAAKAEIKRILDENIVWLAEESIKQTKIPQDDLVKLTSEEIIQKVRATSIVSRKEQLIAAVIRELQEGSFVAATDAEKIKKRLRNAPTISVLFR